MSAAYYEDVDDVDDGDWVIRNGIRVWVEAPAKDSAPKTYDLSQLIACPSCHAKVTETCKTSSGRPTTPHSVRLTPRLCTCGASLSPGRRLCDACRDATVQECKNEYLRRQRRGAA